MPVPNKNQISPDISRNAHVKSKIKKQGKTVVESWEDEDVSSGLESEDGGTRNVAEAVTVNSNDRSVASASPLTFSPPFTTASYSTVPSTTNGGASDQHGLQLIDSASQRRPEKTDAVAKRMIAGALGLRAPKQTEEQKAYQKAIRDQEKKRRDDERSEERKRQVEAEQARAAVWDN